MNNSWNTKIIKLSIFNSCNFQTDDNDTAHHHVAYSWVTIRLRDINDNVPEFSHKFLELNVPENIEIGKSLHSFVASDKDNDGHSKIMYSISKKSDIRRNFQIDQQGTVFIQRSLDRELTPFHKVNFQLKKSLCNNVLICCETPLTSYIHIYN